MKPTNTGRVLATFFLGIMFGIFRHYDEIKWLGRGRDAYLADQGRRFDKFVQYHSAPTMLIAGVILAIVVFGLYEVLAGAITRVLPPPTVVEE